MELNSLKPMILNIRQIETNKANTSLIKYIEHITLIVIDSNTK